jgi:hypothetical protein
MGNTRSHFLAANYFQEKEIIPLLKRSVLQSFGVLNPWITICQGKSLQLKLITWIIAFFNALNAVTSLSVQTIWFGLLFCRRSVKGWAIAEKSLMKGVSCNRLEYWILELLSVRAKVYNWNWSQSANLVNKNEGQKSAIITKIY